MEKISDQLLWSQLKAGKNEALATIYNDHFESLYNYGLKFTVDRNTVEDCIQELFIYLWDHRTGLSDTDSIRPYLLVSLRRRLIKNIKKQNKFSDIDHSLPYFHAEIDEKNLEQSGSDDRMAQVLDSMSELSSRQREVLYLRYQQGYDFNEIASILDINYQSARNLASRALTKLRDVLTFLIIIMGI